MLLPTISNEAASRIWNSRDRGEEPDTSNISVDYIGDDGAGEKLTDLELQDLIEPLLEIREEFLRRYPAGLPKSIGGEVDTRIVRPIHSHLASLAQLDQLTRAGFWRWLSNVACQGFFWEFLAWRFPKKMQINWGITTSSRLVEVYFYRAWLRGHLMYDPSLPDPYLYAEKGASDIWRSQILRQDFGRDPNFVRAFLDTVYDKGGKSRFSSTKVRETVIPALRAWTSGGTFSHLNYDDCKQLIERLIKEGI